MSFNKITIVGYLGRDPELKYTPQGTALCKFTVATTERRKNPIGEYEDQTTWFRVTVWNRQAELANEYLAKGRQVYVEGRLRMEEYTDKEGQKRVSLEVSASDLQFLGGRNELPGMPSGVTPAVNASVQAHSAEEKAADKPAKRRPKVEVEEVEEEMIPF